MTGLADRKDFFAGGGILGLSLASTDAGHSQQCGSYYSSHVSSPL
jgi:hypothetical protein